MSAMQQPFAPTARMIAAKRQALLDAALAYVREGKDGTMRDRLRTASAASGIPERELEAAVGDIDRLRADLKDRTIPAVTVVLPEEKKT